MSKISKYNKPKTTNGGSMVVINNISNKSEYSLRLEPHTIFGLVYDGTNDVEGDITNVKNITSTGGDIKVIKEGDKGGNVIVNGRVSSSEIKTNSLSATNGNIDNIISTNGNINSIISTTGNINNLSSDTGRVNNLSGLNISYNLANLVQSVIRELLGGNATFDNITVTNSAHFFKLVIDEIKSVGGNVIITPANAKLDKVLTLGDRYRCLFKMKDGDKLISNNWRVNDLAFCQTFNLNGNSNKFYWRLVIGVGNTIIDDISYHYIDLSLSDKYGDSIPAAEDEVVLLGNRNEEDRLNAIIISAYLSIDTSVKPPSIAQYKGIRDYRLEPYKYNVTAANGNTFRGNFYVESGLDLKDYVGDTVQHGKAPRISSDGYWEYYDNGRWIKTDTKALGDRGSKGDTGKRGERGRDGAKGENAISYKLYDNGNTKAEVDINKNINLKLDLSLILIDGSMSLFVNLGNIEVAGITVNPSNNRITHAQTIRYTNQFSFTIFWKINGVIVDTYTIPVVLAPAASFSVTDEINSKVLNHKQSIDNLIGKTTLIENNVSTVRLTADLIKSLITSVNGDINSLYGRATEIELNVSNIKQTSREIQLTIRNLQNGLSLVFETVGEIQQTADSISSRVTTLENGKPNLIGNDFFTQSDNHSGLSIVYSNGSFIMKQTQKLDIDFANTPTRTQLEYGKKYLLSFIPITNGADVRFQILVQLSQNDRWWDNTKTIIDYNESSYYNNNLYSKVIEVTDPNKRYFSMYVESNWNEINKENSKLKQTTLPWTITLKDLRLTEISEKESIIAQKASRIELSVRDGLKKSGIDISSG